MEPVGTPSRDTVWNQLSGLFCTLRSTSEEEKSKIVDLLKSAVAQLEKKQPLSLPYPDDEACESDQLPTTKDTTEVVCDGDYSSCEFPDAHQREADINEASSPFHSSSATAYEASDMFLKDILSSTFPDDTASNSEHSKDNSDTAVELVSDKCDTPVVQAAPSRPCAASKPAWRRLKPQRPLALSCPICHNTFTEWKCLEQHLYVGHTNSLAPVCWRCQGVFDNHAVLLAHECFDWGRVNLPCQGSSSRGANGLTGRHKALLQCGSKLGFPENGVFLRRRCGLCFKSTTVFRSYSEFQEHKKTNHASYKLGAGKSHSETRGRRLQNKRPPAEESDSINQMDCLHPKNEAALQSCVRRLFERFSQMDANDLSTVSQPKLNVAEANTGGPSSSESSNPTGSSTHTVPVIAPTDSTTNDSSVEHTRASGVSVDSRYQNSFPPSPNLFENAEQLSQPVRRNRAMRTILWRRKRKLNIRRVYGRKENPPDASGLENSPTGPKRAAPKRYVCRCCSTEFRVASRLRAHHLFQHGNIPASLGGLSPHPGERGSSQSSVRTSRTSHHQTKPAVISAVEQSNDHAPIPDSVEERTGTRSTRPTTDHQLKPMIRFPEPLVTESDQSAPPTQSDADLTSTSAERSSSTHCTTKSSRIQNSRTNPEKRSEKSNPKCSDPPYVCSFCNRQYLSMCSLQRHESQNHRGQYRLHCGYCDYRTNERPAYDEHLARHFHVRQFACQFCDARFIVNRELKDHIAFKHTTERNYHCAVCGKTFKTAGTLSRHRKTHEDRKLHQCNLCSTTFTRLSNLKRHMSNAHMRSATRRFGSTNSGRRSNATGQVHHEEPDPGHADTVVPPPQSAAALDSESALDDSLDSSGRTVTTVTVVNGDKTEVDSSQSETISAPLGAELLTQMTNGITSSTSESALPSQTNLPLHSESGRMYTLVSNESELSACQETMLQANTKGSNGAIQESASLGPVYVVDLSDLDASHGLLETADSLTHHATHHGDSGEVRVDLDQVHTPTDPGTHYTDNPDPHHLYTTETLSTAILLQNTPPKTTERMNESNLWMTSEQCVESHLCFGVDQVGQLLRTDSDKDVEVESSKQLSNPGAHSVVLGHGSPIVPSSGVEGTATHNNTRNLFVSYPSSPMLVDKSVTGAGIWRPIEALDVDTSGSRPDSHVPEQFDHSEFVTFDCHMLLDSGESAVTVGDGLYQSPRFPSPVSETASPRTLLYSSASNSQNLIDHSFSVSHVAPNQMSLSTASPISNTCLSKSQYEFSNVLFANDANQCTTHGLSQFPPVIWCYPAASSAAPLTHTLTNNMYTTSPSDDFPTGSDQCSNFSVGYLIGQNQDPGLSESRNVMDYHPSGECNGAGGTVSTMTNAIVTSPASAMFFEFDSNMS